MSSEERSEIYSRAKSFQYAFEGWRYILRTQHNAWIHAFFSLAVVGVALWLGIPGRDWAVLILTISLVWMAELTNTALEALIDLSSPEFHPLAKVAKDVSAAAVLLGAIASIFIGILLLGPPLVTKLADLF